MLMYKGLKKLEKMGALICNGDCNYCLYKQALKSADNGLDVYRQLYRYGAMTTKQYKIIRELEEDYAQLSYRCSQYRETE
ncbi:hypothetical protein [Clostridium sp.]|jgi:sulfatase maturation enzyme AslB (radical SAM superfamily)|uniref:hypothetical protein n=1 Tax=Clostridium sp. TaxID=1506 RepID=UPI002841A0E5|nr:hypothetical protein [Clostridium sp.]MDR3597065.1 hypothetical protein [Clostridium sp.]